MAPIRLAVAGALVLLSLGCSLAPDCGWQPIGASIRAPTLPAPDADGIGNCGKWIRIDGVEWVQNEHFFSIDPSTLEPIGEATETSRFVTELAAPHVYEIDGVDPNDAIAMEAIDGTIIVFTPSARGSEFPPALCPMLSPDDSRPPEGCA